MAKKKLKADLERELTEQTELLHRFVTLQEEGQIEFNCDDAKSLNRDVRVYLGCEGETDRELVLSLKLPVGICVPAGTDPNDSSDVEDTLTVTVKDHEGNEIHWDFHDNSWD